MFRILIPLLFATMLPMAVFADSAASGGQKITVYKSPSCGCCASWAKYLADNGFDVTVVDRDDLSALKARFGITPSLRSCHTAIVDGYAIEGHVPVNDIRRLLRERPEVAGLTAPGMPMMSPGMASIEPKDYDVLAFERDGTARIYSRY